MSIADYQSFIDKLLEKAENKTQRQRLQNLRTIKPESINDNFGGLNGEEGVLSF